MKQNEHYTVCTNCVMDTSDPNIKFDEQGVCERCNEFKSHVLPQWNYGKGHEHELGVIVDKIKAEGKNRPYDCLLGMSGGFDSSYMLHFAIKELGLRPLVFHIDAGWNIPFAEENIKRMVDKLGVDLKVEKMNWEVMTDMQLAFFKAGIPHLDTPQDHAFVSVLDSYAKRHKIKYILNGGNISTEVIVNPNEWGYWGTDIVHFKDILSRFGTLQKYDYPFTNVINRKIVMPYLYGVKVIKLLNLTPYVKIEAEGLLKKEYGYIPYPQKHFEDIITKFLEGYWLPERFGYDVRKPQFSSLILTGQMTRKEALEKLVQPPLNEQEAKELFTQVTSMLKISEAELLSYMELPLKTYKDYKHRDWMFNAGAKIMYLLGLDKLIRK